MVPLLRLLLFLHWLALFSCLLRLLRLFLLAWRCFLTMLTALTLLSLLPTVIMRLLSHFCCRNHPPGLLVALFFFIITVPLKPSSNRSWWWRNVDIWVLRPWGLGHDPFAPSFAPAIHAHPLAHPFAYSGQQLLDGVLLHISNQSIQGLAELQIFGQCSSLMLLHLLLCLSGVMGWKEEQLWLGLRLKKMREEVLPFLQQDTCVGLL
mmetsp:Transcript_43394/g.77952  ORF Transcript_43394/g.77952 Transcript_43394/m.77952 type:complete len:207 (+) Transcript_43394:421-1041(+)